MIKVIEVHSNYFIVLFGSDCKYVKLTKDFLFTYCLFCLMYSTQGQDAVGVAFVPRLTVYLV